MNLRVTCFNLGGAGSITCQVCNVEEPFEVNALGYIIQFRVSNTPIWIVTVNARNGAVTHSCNRRVHWTCREHGDVVVKFKIDGARRRRTPRRSIRDRVEVCPECMEPVTRHYEFVPLADYMMS